MQISLPLLFCPKKTTNETSSDRPAIAMEYYYVVHAIIKYVN